MRAMRRVVQLHYLCDHTVGFDGAEHPRCGTPESVMGDQKIRVVPTVLGSNPVTGAECDDLLAAAAGLEMQSSRCEPRSVDHA